MPILASEMLLCKNKKIQWKESEAMRGLDSNPIGGNIFHLILLFSCSKVSDANICIIAILVHFEKKKLY